MKKIVLVPVSLLLMLIGLTVACEPEEDEICEKFAPPTCAIEATYCNDGGVGYYLYEDDKYSCKMIGGDENCDEAIGQILIKGGCVKASANLKQILTSEAAVFMNDVAHNVMLEARACAGCN